MNVYILSLLSIAMVLQDYVMNEINLTMEVVTYTLHSFVN